MRAASYSVPSIVDNSSEQNSAPAADQKSLTKVFDLNGQPYRRRKTDTVRAGNAKAFKAYFLDNWSAFLKENFKNTEAVAVDFDVRHQTAVNWWNGVNKPSGDTVAWAFICYRDAIDRQFCEVV